MGKPKIKIEYIKTEFLKRDLILISKEYKNNKTPLKYICKKHKNEGTQTKTWADFKKGTGCKVCGKEKSLLNRTKTHNQFVLELHNLKPDIICISQYKNSNTKMTFKCLKCGHIWDTVPSVLVNKGCGCPSCAGNEKKTNEDFIAQLKDKNIIALESYKGTHTQIKFKCLVDGCEWKAEPNSIISGNQGCPKCGIKSRTEIRTKPTEVFVSELASQNPYVELIGQYINALTPTEFKCLRDNKTFIKAPNELLKGHYCPYCNSTKGEASIMNYLDSNNIKYNIQHTFEGCKHTLPLRFDFYLEKENQAIEYDGEFHYQITGMTTEEDLLDQQYKDEIKNKYCKDNNIKLLRIPYWEFNNIETILKNTLP